MDEVMKVNCSADLRECPVPIFYLLASNDRIVRRESLEQIRRIRPDMAFSLIDGPHLILQQNPGAAAREIARFIEKTLQEL
jgi:surfactin synthase thioesterase subunit